ncbi:MAG: hypothetical protein ACMG57_04890 [Candidatus Dojkabacteria bacterium]
MDQKEKSNVQQKEGWQERPWKAWNSWASWESPIGLSLCWGILFVSTCLGIYLLHLANVIK